MSSLSFDERCLKEAMMHISGRSSEQQSIRPVGGFSRRHRRRRPSRRRPSFTSIESISHVEFDVGTSPTYDVCSKRALHNISPEAFPPLPFCDSRVSSDCLSISSDQAVLNDGMVSKRNVAIPTFVSSRNCEPKMVRSVEVSSSFHTEPQSPEEDSFDLSTMIASHTNMNQAQCYNSQQFSLPISIPGYALGQEGHPIDMKVESTRKSAQLVVSLLSPCDAAFIRRSGGRWCYAVLAEKIMPDNEQGQCQLRFVVDDEGSTKNISFSRWGEYVRMAREPIEAKVMSKLR